MGKTFLWALAALNAASFAVYGLDKQIARRNGARVAGAAMRRVSEKALFIWAAMGPLGAFVGMKFWRHKTKHWYFAFGVPVILLAEAVFACWLWRIF